MLYLKIAIAGGLGSVLRYGLARFSLHLMGCFLIGYLSITMAQRWGWSEQNQIVVMTGLLGGFTTFSAFSFETMSMMQQGQALRAVIYVVATVCLCLLMCWLGMALARYSL